MEKKLNKGLLPCPWCGCDMHAEKIMTPHGVGYIPKGRHLECPLDGVMFDYWEDADELRDDWNERVV